MDDDKKIITSVLDQYKDQMQPLASVQQILKQLSAVTGYMQHLENALIGMSQEVQAQGLGLQMILRMFIDKGLFTEEEIKQYHTTCVFEPMKQAAEEMQAKVQAAEEEARKAQIANTVAEDTYTEEETESDVVLASEKSNVVRFPNGEK